MENKRLSSAWTFRAASQLRWWYQSKTVKEAIGKIQSESADNEDDVIKLTSCLADAMRAAWLDGYASHKAAIYEVINLQHNEPVGADFADVSSAVDAIIHKLPNDINAYSVRDRELDEIVCIVSNGTVFYPNRIKI